ncbi:MAG TPA: ABC transporter substrate-binding protein [Pyrinomonadaceae bacterium]
MKKLAALFLLLSLGFCLDSQSQTPGAVRIGVFLSLTGATASYGVSALNAIKLATEETNQNGGINGKKIELVVEDDHSNTQEVPGIVTKLIKEAKVDALIAEPVSTRAMAAAPIAKTAKPDIIFAPGFYTTAPLVARTVKQLAIKSTLIGSDGWDSPDLLAGGAAPFAGVYFANHFWIGSNEPLVRKFVKDYQTKYGIAPDAGAATAYDAAHLLFDAFKRAKSTDKTAVRDALATTKDFPGRDRQNHDRRQSQCAGAGLYVKD